MNDRPRIVVGLVIALVVLTVPFWYSLAAGSAEGPPQVELPAGQSTCVADNMKAHHMELLNQWRNEVVRKGDTTFVEVNHKKYPKSLTRGCMCCHTSRQKFCYRCHSYAGVEPACWNCHVEPKGE